MQLLHCERGCKPHYKCGIVVSAFPADCRERVFILLRRPCALLPGLCGGSLKLYGLLPRLRGPPQRLCFWRHTAQALPKRRRKVCRKPAKTPAEKTADLIHIKALQYREKCSIIIKITIDITIGRKTYEYIICIFRKLQQARA